jgi:cation-transporting ATPase 13A1
MVLDFFGCWIVELVCKRFLADLEPKRMITRGRDRREERRRTELPKQKVKAN